MNDCKKITGEDIILGKTDKLYFDKKIFEPYNSYIFKIEASTKSK